MRHIMGGLRCPPKDRREEEGARRGDKAEDPGRDCGHVTTARRPVDNPPGSLSRAVLTVSPMSVSQLIALANQLEQSGVGYDQGDRWSWLDRDARTILNYREADCSSACLGLAWLAGYPVDLDGTAYTGNAEQLLTAAGFTSRSIDGLPLHRIVNDARPGDMLLGPGHIVLVGDPATRWLSAENDERGKATGGQAGDQTGLEVRWRAPYMRSRGWTRLLRPPVDDTPAPAPAPSLLVVDGVYGPKTKRALQAWLGVTVDGVIGDKTIKTLQTRLGVKADGKIGEKTIKALQELTGATVDGKWGPKTTAALQTYLNQR